MENKTKFHWYPLETHVNQRDWIALQRIVERMGSLAEVDPKFRGFYSELLAWGLKVETGG